MPQIDAVGGGGRGGIKSSRHLANDVDLFDDIAPSTVAMIILFGSIIFATIGMGTRDWLMGDKRALSAATAISSANDSSKKNNDTESSRADESIINKSQIQPWEPTFISTFILLFQISLFGIILFAIYSLESQSSFNTTVARSLSVTSSSGFDEDEFIFLILAVSLYAYFISWKRNDGKLDNKEVLLDGVNNVSDEAATYTSRTTTSRSKMKEKIRNRKLEMASLRQTIETGSKDGASSQGSDLSKRLEEVLLTDDTVFDSILDTIEDDIHSKDESELGLLEKGSKFLGFNVAHIRSRKICEVKRENDVLNRSQTLEWKGFLSIVMLIYQYNMGQTHLSVSNIETNDSPNRVQIYENLTKAAISSLLFLTGYNHTYYFYYHPSNNYSAFKVSRVLQVCARINLLAISLGAVLGKARYGLCLVHTCWFLLIWLAMNVGYSMNYDKYFFRLKLLGIAVGIFLFWDCNISALAKMTGVWEVSQAIWEWYCILHLHHWSAFVGVIFAINQPIASLQLRKLESLNLLSSTFAKLLLSGTLSFLTLVWATGPLRKSDMAYNVSHPYFGIVPTLLLVNLRNLNCWLREHHIGMFAWLGKYSVEIYILHHHTRNIVFNRGYPRCNFLVASVILIFTAQLLQRITSVIRYMTLPVTDDKKCLRNTLACFIGSIILYVLARTLVWADMVSPGSIMTIVMIAGILLYQMLMELTWASYRSTAPKLKRTQFEEEEEEAGETFASKVSPPLIATLFVIALGYALYQTALAGRSQVCSAYQANKGRWVPLNACLSRPKLDRQFNSINYFGPSQCSTFNMTEQWAWTDACGFHYQNGAELQLKLQQKRIIFIGDSSVRHLYHSLNRITGDSTAGGYEGTSPSHTDASSSFGSTSLEFKWAPLSVDIITKIKSLKASLPADKVGTPDLIIAGAGVWDKLHLSVTDEDQRSQEGAIKTLAGELQSMRKIGVKIVWFVPPVINTMALNSDEKRSQISEGNIEEMRRMHAELGVPKSASFVLDGPKFTQYRVSDSFDGVHYPNDVYDAGIQIVMNALDLLWGDTNNVEPRSYLPAVSSLKNPYLGLMMLCFVLIGLFYFDGYFGVAYLAQFFVKKVSLAPSELYKDAFDQILTAEEHRGASNSDHKGVQEQESVELMGRSTSSLSRRR